MFKTLLRKKYRLASSQTGIANTGWTHRFKFTAAWTAAKFEYIAMIAGVRPGERWLIVRRPDGDNDPS